MLPFAALIVPRSLLAFLRRRRKLHSEAASISLFAVQFSNSQPRTFFFRAWISNRRSSAARRGDSNHGPTGYEMNFPRGRHLDSIAYSRKTSYDSGLHRAIRR